MQKSRNFAIIIVAMAVVALHGCSAYRITRTSEGYDLKLPADVIETFPKSHRIEITLDDPKLGKSSVVGIATLSENGGDRLLISTTETFGFEPINRGTFLLLRSKQGQPGAGWSGCSRDLKLSVSKYGDSICWCWSDLATIAQ